ncbi:MAG: cupin domain-containing protein [Spirochaetes bacterium]|nr:MAG: cupin domain-containing protein [Spirochaetota bacterium]
MHIFNKANSRDTGDLEILTSHMLIGSRNVGNAGISIQVSSIPVGSEQPLHRHAPEQCYYIIRGTGLMVIEEERETVNTGDAIYVPGDTMHGIKNTGSEVLEYLTANAPAFDAQYEDRLWPGHPHKQK